MAVGLSVAVVLLAVWLSGAGSAPFVKVRLSTPALVSPAAVEDWQNLSGSSAATFPGNDTVWVDVHTPDLLVEMSPSDHDLEFVVNGLVNPAVHVPSGIPVTIHVVNLDPSEDHSWVLTTRAPPYGAYPMMSGGGMMGGSSGMWGTSMMGAPQGGSYWSQTMWFTTAAPGQFWYLCSYPDHASSDMYGAFVVG